MASAGVAALAASGIAACGGSSSNNNGQNKASKNYGTIISGSVPAVGKPSNGGTISVGQITGQTPTDIFPMIDGATCSTQTFYFVSNQYVPLYYGPTGAKPAIDPSLSAADTPQYSDGDKTVTINLKPGLKWSDGKPVDAEDVIFYLDLLKAAVKESPANWCQYSPGEIPDNVASWTTKGKDTVVLHLKTAVNPNWFTANQLQDTNGGVYPMPSQDWNVDSAGGAHITDWATNPTDAKKVYDYLHKQGASVATFASNPLWKVVDGPFKLKDYSATNNSYDLVPNPTYGLSPKPRMADVSFQTYTSSTAMLNAMESGSLDIGQIDSGTQLGSIPTLKRKGYSVFGGPGWGWFGGFINFKDTTDDFDKIVAQPYIRGVFAELVDQASIIKDVYHNWAVPAYGPVSTAPTSPYVNPAIVKATYPYNPSKAVSTLKAHGWTVKPGGQTTCAKPGTATNECGAGIPAGTPIKFVWANVPYSTASTGVLESQVFASEAKKAAGIDVQLVTKTFNFLTANYNNQNPAAAKYVNDWGVNNYGGIFTDYYPTQDGLMNPGGALNMGSFDDPVANKLMHASTSSPSAKAISDEVAYFGKSYPVFYMPDYDYITAVSNKVGGAAQFFLEMTQQQIDPQGLYVNKQ
ncbi:MAG TPA: ABC transporter substrate-binding protein [Solirubrobacteraceae bacterium]|nr:ABC transporter substrate-binding protein [Solirubrobacteraceae bacterium]